MSKTKTLAEAPNDSALAQVGEIKMWPVATPPTGYLVCDGSQVSRTTYAALFALVGTAFGAGDGSTTFNLPNYTNRMAIGAGGLYSAAATGGSKDAIAVAHAHTFSVTTGTESVGHTHTFSATTGTESATHVHGTGTGGSFLTGSASSGTTGWAGGGNYTHVQPTTNTAGQSTTHTHSVSGTTGTVSANHTHSVSGTTASTGSSGTDANLPPYLAIFFIIKH
jgi:microcystin-dependent protein